MTHSGQIRNISIKDALSFYLSHRFDPQLPEAYVEIALVAIAFCQSGLDDELVAIDATVDPKPVSAVNLDGKWFAKASEIAQILRLDKFVAEFGDLTTIPGTQ